MNDWVLITTHPLSSAPKKVVAKFKPKFEGLYRVLEVKNNNVVVWRSGKRLTVNVNQGLGSNPGEDMDVCKCIVPVRHRGTLNSRQAASPLVRLVEGGERWEASDHPQSVLPLNWGGIGRNRTVTCMVLKATANDRHHLALCQDEFRGPRSGLCRSGGIGNNNNNTTIQKPLEGWRIDNTLKSFKK
ncbi:uncharacterized protein TNCV_1415221 [Trichonephila clavipes]|nr:uncharacterized protein TNCV_1415221 [Trichonephila clavipes]